MAGCWVNKGGVHTPGTPETCPASAPTWRACRRGAKWSLSCRIGLAPMFGDWRGRCSVNCVARTEGHPTSTPGGGDAPGTNRPRECRGSDWVQKGNPCRFATSPGASGPGVSGTWNRSYQAPDRCRLARTTRPYTARYMEAVFPPGSQPVGGPGHRHPGPEAWYIVSGSQCLETPNGVITASAGGTALVPEGWPMAV